MHKFSSSFPTSAKWIGKSTFGTNESCFFNIIQFLHSVNLWEIKQPSLLEQASESILFPEVELLNHKMCYWEQQASPNTDIYLEKSICLTADASTPVIEFEFNVCHPRRVWSITRRGILPSTVSDKSLAIHHLQERVAPCWIVWISNQVIQYSPLNVIDLVIHKQTNVQGSLQLQVEPQAVRIINSICCSNNRYSLESSAIWNRENNPHPSTQAGHWQFFPVTTQSAKHSQHQQTSEALENTAPLLN